jgi:hypothetical protein
MARWPFFFYFIPSLPEILWKVGSLAWRVRAPWRVGLYLFRFQPSRDSLEGGLAHLGKSTRHGALAFIYFFSSHPEFLWRVDLLTLASPHAMACWSFFFYFIPSLPEILWKVGSLTWRVCAPRRVGLYLFLFQPSRVPLEGGLTHLGESMCHGTLAFISFISSLPEFLWRVDLLTLVSPHATVCWPLRTLSPAFQGSPGRWARSLGEPACHGTLAFLFLFHSQPSRDLLEGGLARLASPCAMACWLLFTLFPAFQSTSGRWACLLGKSAHCNALAVLRGVGLYVFIFTCLKNAQVVHLL